MGPDRPLLSAGVSTSPRSLVAGLTRKATVIGMRLVLRLFVVVTVLCLAAAGALVLFSPAEEPPSWGKGSALTQPAVVDGRGNAVAPGEGIVGTPHEKLAARVRVDVLVDGWSARTLAGAPLRARTSGGLTPAVPALSPVSESDLRELLNTSPELVTNALARQVSGSDDLVCGPDGCTAGGRDLDVAALVSAPSRVENLGAVYESWGVTSLLWHTSVTVPADDPEVTFSAQGFRAFTVLGLPTGDDAGPHNGWLRNRFLVAAGFGQLFPVHPAWLEDDGGRLLAAPSEDTPRDIEVSASLLHVTGLAAPRPRAKLLTPSALTYYSSPTTGCDVGVLCTPEAVAASLSDVKRSQNTVCTTDAAQRNVAVMESAVLTVDFGSKTTHQFGMWAGKRVEEFKHSTGSGVLLGGVPPVVRGEQSMRWSVIGLYSGPGAQLRVTSGFFGPASSDALSLVDALGGVSLDGTTWVPCS